MAQSATSQQPSEATTPEKTAPAQLNTMPPHNRYTLQPAQFQPLDAPKPGPFRPSKMFSMGKLVLGTANFTFAIIVLGLSIGVLTVELYDIVVIITAGVMVRSNYPLKNDCSCQISCDHIQLTFLEFFLLLHRLLFLSSGKSPSSSPSPSDAPSTAPFILAPTWAYT